MSDTTKQSMQLLYQQSSPTPDKILNQDGSITTSSGTQIAPADESRALTYENASPAPVKFLHPDGSIDTNGGGGDESTKANIIPAVPSWDPANTIPIVAGTVLHIDTTYPLVFDIRESVGGVALGGAVVVGNDTNRFWGMWTIDNGATSHFGRAQVTAETIIMEEDIWNSTDGWLTDTYVMQYGFATDFILPEGGGNYVYAENVGEISQPFLPFSLFTDISTDAHPAQDLIDVKNELEDEISNVSAKASKVSATDTTHIDVKGSNVQSQLNSTDEQIHGLKEIVAGSSQLFHTAPTWEADSLEVLQTWVQPDDTAYDPINERQVQNFDIYLALDTGVNYYFDSNAWVPLAPTPEAGIDIIKVFAPNSTTLNVTLSSTPMTTVTTGSFMVYDMITGNPVTVSAITGGAANYVLEVTQSRGVGITFFGN
jgi:hypothetical protein